MTPITQPQEKKVVLMNLIDDMTAAAIDRSSQGYSQFLYCREQLVGTIDKYMQEDQQRIDFALNVADEVNKIFQNECTNNRS